MRGQILAKFAINEGGAMLLLSLVQVSESISGSVVPLAMFSRDLVVLLFLDTFEYRKCLETGEMTKSLENNNFSGDLVIFPVSRHF